MELHGMTQNSAPLSASPPTRSLSEAEGAVEVPVSFSQHPSFSREMGFGATLPCLSV